jgi:fido (protein-threonine AMPylation protein)
MQERSAFPELLFEFHQALFSGVRSHAGRCRRQDFGSEYLVFGPNRSLHRSKVLVRLDEIFLEVRTSITSFDANPEDLSYEEKGFALAVWAHAEIVRVHPFEDGNGRSARAVMNWILVRLGLRPIAIEVPKDEYHGCLNHYYRHGDLQPLVDVALSLYRLS